MIPEAFEFICEDVAREVDRQIKKWGVQEHPSGTGRDLELPIPWNDAISFGDKKVAFTTAELLESAMRGRTEDNFRENQGTYEMIFTEEWAEVIAAETDEELEKELIQALAVGFSWLNLVRQRKAARMEMPE